ncbi:O-methyltransferase [Paenibacillus dakarensis]|uniref:O-methyltransferase n=1 Tax=Paenibacillus dakarensis TaxID=1527293 RepID=UPI0006D578BC|nr:class I SAM-dependent methyltransferase [Paenibacillus dakarensis]
MDEHKNIRKPLLSEQVRLLAEEKGFTMSCDDLTGNMLRTLVSAKPGSRILELGTGAGYSTTWILDGMDGSSSLISVESEADFANIAIEIIKDNRVQFHVGDGGAYIEEHSSEKFDIIFADTWPGKFYMVEEVLEMVAGNGLYIIDDLNPQTNWPEGHGDKVIELLEFLDQREDFHKVKLDWSTGIMMMTKK